MKIKGCDFRHPIPRNEIEVLIGCHIRPLVLPVCGFFFIVALRPNAGHGLLILEVSRSHTTTHYSR